MSRERGKQKAQKICAAIISLIVTSQVLILTLPAHAQKKYGAVGGWVIEINESGYCHFDAAFEGGDYIVFGYIEGYEGIVYGNPAWKLPKDVNYALELVFTNGTRIPVVGSTIIIEGFSAISIQFKDERLTPLFRYSDDMEIISRESEKSVTHVTLRDSNAAYASWRLCVEENHFTEQNPFGSGQPSSDTNPFERGS